MKDERTNEPLCLTIIRVINTQYPIPSLYNAYNVRCYRVDDGSKGRSWCTGTRVYWKAEREHEQCLNTAERNARKKARNSRRARINNAIVPVFYRSEYLRARIPNRGVRHCVFDVPTFSLAILYIYIFVFVFVFSIDPRIVFPIIIKFDATTSKLFSELETPYTGRATVLTFRNMPCQIHFVDYLEERSSFEIFLMRKKFHLNFNTFLRFKKR